MRTLIFAIGGILAGYILGNLEEKRFDEIIEDMTSKGKRWVDVIAAFIGQSAMDIEGFDSDTIKLNVDIFLEKLMEYSDEYLEIEDFNEKIAFVEEKITEVTADLIKKSEKLNK